MKIKIKGLKYYFSRISKSKNCAKVPYLADGDNYK